MAMEKSRRADVATRGHPADPLQSVVMPAYNERGTIEELVRRVLAVPVRTGLITCDGRNYDEGKNITWFIE
jgi:hypothetical protein